MAKILHGRDEICEHLSLPWPVLLRLARYGGLPVQDLGGPVPFLEVAAWIAWQKWENEDHDTTSIEA